MRDRASRMAAMSTPLGSVALSVTVMSLLSLVSETPIVGSDRPGAGAARTALQAGGRGCRAIIRAGHQRRIRADHGSRHGKPRAGCNRDATEPGPGGYPAPVSFFDAPVPPPPPEARREIPEWAACPPGDEPPVVILRGGSGSDLHRTQPLQRWLLPPEGTLTFAVAWPELDIEESSGTRHTASL